jgi:methionine-rich copper-binding protein CopC
MTHLAVQRQARLMAPLAVVLLVLAAPMVVFGHAELDTSDPAEGAVVEAPFAGPIVMTFTEDLVSGSTAKLVDGAGDVSSTIKITGATLTLTPGAALPEGSYQVRWTSVADDGDVERGTIGFTVVAAATPGPTATPAPTASASPTPIATPPASAPASSSPSPAAGSDASGTSGSGGDVILPIIVGALLVGTLAAFLLRRRDSTSTPS